MTDKLYELDGHIRVFKAVVLSCEHTEGGYAVVLDKTAFFPNGGGQKADTGTIGEVQVLDVNETGEDVVHIVDKPLQVGSEVDCAIDWDKRFRRMQNHAGEHLVCGIIHNIFGYENTGFHMGGIGVTADISGFLNEEQVRRVEHIANAAIGENRKITCWKPNAEELKTIDYRSKLDLTENVRLVSTDGYDICACCAPQPHHTGEIGCIKILEHSRYRGGTRLILKCGLDAMEDYNERCRSISAISALLSAKPEEVAQAVEHLWDENTKLKRELEKVTLSSMKSVIDSIKPCEGNAGVFVSSTDLECLREIVNAGVPKCGGIFAAFGGCDGDYKYVLGSTSVDLREYSKQFNSALCGRGGGKPNMIQGSVGAKKPEILEFLSATEM